jgi:nucleoid-associated protein YgaU
MQQYWWAALGAVKPTQRPSPTSTGGTPSLIQDINAPIVENGRTGAARTIRILGVPNATPAAIAPPRNFVFWFPVAPQIITKTGSLNRNTFQVIMGGERAHAAGPSLGTIAFESFFPGPIYDERICKALRSELDYVDPVVSCQLMEYLRDSGSVVTLNYGSGEINEKVQITDFSWTETAGQPFHRQFSITFGIWEPQIVKVSGGVRLPPLPKSYVVREGETLSDVALRMYGDSRKWRDILDANATKSEVQGRTPKDKINAGVRLVIPRELNLINPDWVQGYVPTG